MFDIDIATVLRVISILAIPMVFAITVHEVAHGWVAKQLGDKTAERAGRLTLNPVPHIDPIGTVVVPLGMAFFTGGQAYFGWAKPVPVTISNLRSPKRDMVLVAAAGPGANLVMAAIWTALYVVVLTAGIGRSEWLSLVCQEGIEFNCLLMVFNLLPIPPLDGGRVLTGLLPRPAAEVVSRIEPFGIIIVLVLMLPPIAILWTLLEPPLVFVIDGFYDVVRNLT